MITFSVQLDTFEYKSKPAGAEVSKLKPRLAGFEPSTLDISTFAEAVTNGRSFSPAVLSGGAKAENWKSQQLFCIDIDNEDKTAPKGEKKQAECPLDVDEVLKRCEQWSIKPALMYSTFSSSDEWLKFRIAFVCERSITDGSERDLIQLALMEIFPECDTTCKNRDRLFFGGKGVIYIDEQACFSPVSLNILSNAIQSKVKFESFDRQHSKQADKLEELKRSFDFLSYIRQNNACSERKAGQCIFFNPCPICSHKDDFVFYPQTNTFMCFGANGNVGGSIIDYLMSTKHIDKSTAIDFFKYDLCGLEKQDKAEIRKNILTEKSQSAGFELSNNELPEYIVMKVNEKTGDVSYYVSCPLLAKYIRSHSHYIMVADRNSRQSRVFWYIDGVYTPVNDDMIQGFIKQYITKIDETLLKMRDVKEVLTNLKTDLVFFDDSKLNADENIINFKNGLLSLTDMKIYPHTPTAYSTIQIPCNYTPNNFNAPVFKSFLETLTGGDKEKQELLLEFMGVCISNIKGYRMKQALFMFGKGDSGKSQLKVLTESLLGQENCSACDLSTLEERFGTSQLYMKRLVGSGDMSFVSVKELKIFKSATGGDEVFVEFKGRDGFRYKFGGQFWFCTNELPRFGGDRGEWVYKRIIAFDCNNTIPEEKQDKFIADKMYAEREAIVNILLQAVQRLIKNGFNYAIPTACKLNKEEYKERNSPVRTFVNEYCIIGDVEKAKSENCTTGKVYNVFKEWYTDNYGFQYKISNQSFRKELAEILDKSVNELEVRTKQGRFYPLTLTLEAKATYQHVYGFYNAGEFYNSTKENDK